MLIEPQGLKAKTSVVAIIFVQPQPHTINFGHKKNRQHNQTLLQTIMFSKIDTQPSKPVRRGSSDFFAEFSDDASSSNTTSTSPPVRSRCRTPPSRAASPPMAPSRHPEPSSAKSDSDDEEAMITKETTFKAPRPFQDEYEKAQKKEKREPKRAKNANKRQRSSLKARILVQHCDPLSPICENPKYLRRQLVDWETLLSRSEKQGDGQGLFEDSFHLLVALEGYISPEEKNEEVVCYSSTPAGATSRLC